MENYVYDVYCGRRRRYLGCFWFCDGGGNGIVDGLYFLLINVSGGFIIFFGVGR